MKDNYAHDIALLRLKEEVTISTFVLPACFRTTDRAENGGFDPGLNIQGEVGDGSGDPLDAQTYCTHVGQVFTLFFSICRKNYKC